ncbi:hypothetical protein COUCH_37145 [Couchioplanes caeruleus]|uniref:hypothetical protein n=1 Tax=Couchioplanes caeruleus TaxID=56438 RepID=UPI0020BE9F81|nr:hypothetical protein [Couchioplanes caeruleus]UQU64517.1 hypothetical protein COUCH_37145 [Couchioplanes caeruleus]
MSGEPRGQMWVDPEGVVQLGDSYAEHGALYEGYITQLEQLRSRYGKSWGDDDMGQAFSQRFLEGLDALDGIIGSVKGTLTYTSEGLRQSGHLYRKTDEEAAEMGHYLAGNFDNLPQGVFNRREALQEGETPRLARTRLNARVVSNRAPNTELEASQPVFRTAGEGRFVPPEGRLSRLEPRRAYKSVRPGEEDEELPRARLMPAEAVVASVEPVEGPMSPLLPTVEASFPAQRGKLRPAMPAISAYYQQAGWQGARIDGVPLAEGYQLRGLTTFPDGTTRIDANLYQSITPITPGHTITDADGQPITAPEGPLYVVKDNPSVDPTAPGYEPFFVSFAPDGTAVPIVTDL